MFKIVKSCSIQILKKHTLRTTYFAVFYFCISNALILNALHANEVSIEHAPIAGRPSIIHADARARYVRIILKGEGFLNLAEVEILSKDQKAPDGKALNIAVGKRTAQSSTAMPASHSGLAADGKTDGAFANGSVTHTNKEKDAWWQVDLGKEHTIGEVRIWNREDGVEDRLQNFRVVFSNSSTTQFGFAPEDLAQLTWGYLRIPVFSLTLLALAWSVHLVWWRLHPPKNHNAAILLVFSFVLGLAFLMFPVLSPRLWPIKDVWELILFLSLYVPLALMYVSLYSLVEEQSPSLAVVEYLSRAGAGGRSETEVIDSMNKLNDGLLHRRLEIMERDGLITRTADRLSLTTKGVFWAKSFDIGAKVIGLDKGA